MQVDSGEISYHISSIDPTNHEFLDPTSQLGRYLGRLKSMLRKLKTPQLYDLTGAPECKKRQHSTSYCIYYLCMDYE